MASRYDVGARLAATANEVPAAPIRAAARRFSAARGIRARSWVDWRSSRPSKGLTWRQYSSSTRWASSGMGTSSGASESSGMCSMEKSINAISVANL